MIRLVEGHELAVLGFERLETDDLARQSLVQAGIAVIARARPHRADIDNLESRQRR